MEKRDDTVENGDEAGGVTWALRHSIPGDAWYVAQLVRVKRTVCIVKEYGPNDGKGRVVKGVW